MLKNGRKNAKQGRLNMEFIQAILRVFHNTMLWSAVMAWATAEIVKTLIRFFYAGSRGIKNLWGSGDMPSAHSATVCALAMSAGLLHGFDSYVFALAGVFALVVMYDACGVRLQAGKHAKILNQLASKDKAEEKKLRESVGHTRIQVLSGAVWGVLVATIFVFLREGITF